MDQGSEGDRQMSRIDQDAWRVMNSRNVNLRTKLVVHTGLPCRAEVPLFLLRCRVLLRRQQVCDVQNEPLRINVISALIIYIAFVVKT